jgi:hypothetical protein
MRLRPILLVLTTASIASASWLHQLPLATTGADFQQPGTQPGGILDAIVPSNGCTTCHSGYDEAQEPYTRWAASMMGQAGRDPIFHAAMTIANQDAAGSGEYCMRCHTPGAWLAGRATPADGSALDPLQGDLDGVNCNVCHRLVDPHYTPDNPPSDIGILAALAQQPLSPGNGQYIVDPFDVRRGPFDLGPNFFFHAFEQSSFHRESLLCATCHQVSNPAFSRQANGSYTLNASAQPHPTHDSRDQFPIERTYSEWLESDFAERAIDMTGRFGGDKNLVQSCQDCHMPKITGTGCQPLLGGEVRQDLPQHDLNGANSWVLHAVRSLYPDSETGLSAESVEAAHRRNGSMLARAADLDLDWHADQLRVRIVNQSGHKLPTGYGEGRRMWIEVEFLNGVGNPIATRGAYDPNTAILSMADTKVYEIKHGLDAYMSAQTGKPVGESFHFVLNNTVLKDNRIPPRGFSLPAFLLHQAEPVGVSYAEGQYWDDSWYTIPAGAANARVRVWHQTTTKEYIEFLRDENVTDNKGQIAYNQWVQHGKSRPTRMLEGAISFGAGACVEPVEYGLGKRGSNHRIPHLLAVGSPSVSGAGFSLRLESGVPGALAMVLWSPVSATTPFAGGTMYLGGTTARLGLATLNSFGVAQFPVPLNPALANVARNYQAVLRDSAGSHGLGLSNAIHVQFCQ